MNNPWNHPHPDPTHVMKTYRAYLIGQKRVWMSKGKGSKCLRGLIHYKGFIATYLACKRFLLKKL